MMVASAVLVVAAAALGATLVLRSSATESASHATYAQLWAGTRIGSPMRTVLARWPSPYQQYGDNFKDKCFEWWDKPGVLYNLCFKKGILATMDVG